MPAWIVGLAIASAAAAQAAADVAPCGVALERTDGSSTPLLHEPGQPAVVFYEDRWSTSLNQELKDALYARGKAEGLLDEVRVVAVANIQQYDFFPARGIATAFIRGVEAKAGIPILLDVHGTLSSPPWTLPADGGTVLLVDRGCRERFRHTGKLASDDTQRFFAALEQVVRAPAGGSPPAGTPD